MIGSKEKNGENVFVCLDFSCYAMVRFLFCCVHADIISMIEINFAGQNSGE